MKLSFYTPIAYDYIYAIKSIFSYYDIASEIILAIDKDRISWSNKQYIFDDIFFKQIEELDRDKKIKIYEDNFHLSNIPIENDTNERNYISSKCSGNFIIGIDSDEILLNQKEFFNWLELTKPNEDISCTLITVFKNINNKLLVCQPYESTVIGTKLKNSYKKCRITGNIITKSPLQILHYSWGRTEQEVQEKLKNWGHSKDFNTDKYFELWKSVTLENYHEVKNFHPLRLKQWWQRLELYDPPLFP